MGSRRVVFAVLGFATMALIAPRLLERAGRVVCPRSHSDVSALAELAWRFDASEGRFPRDGRDLFVGPNAILPRSRVPRDAWNRRYLTLRPGLLPLLVIGTGGRDGRMDGHTDPDEAWIVLVRLGSIHRTLPSF